MEREGGIRVKRLTEHRDNGVILVNVIEQKESAIHRLAAIEDILGDDYDLDRLRELAQADREGRCVVLPCKIGSPVYMPIGRWNTITGYELDECDGFHIAKDGILQVKVKCCTGNHGTYGVPGKTVFLTREDAEAALRRDQDE